MRSPAPYLSAGSDGAGQLTALGLRDVVGGVGNVLCSDDGVGIHAVRELERDPLLAAQTLDLGTAILHSISLLAGARRVLLIDAVRGGHPPGTIYRFDATEPAQAEAPAASLHSLGLREALRLLAPDQSPPQITILGVEPQSLEYGLTLSAPVQSALPQLVRMAREIVAAWGAASPGATPKAEDPVLLN